MGMSGMYCKDEVDLERQADILLDSVPFDSACPTYAEWEMARKRRGRGEEHCLFSVNDVNEEFIIATRPPQSFREELVFLASLTQLSLRERICLHGWVEGWTQREMASEIGIRSQQMISRYVRSALWKCYEVSELSFAAFSRHTVYRRPTYVWKA